VSRARRQKPVRPAARARGFEWRPAALVLAGLLAYAGSFQGPFLFDDFGGIVRNTSIQDLTNLRAVLSPADATAVAGRPIANLTFAINHALGGLDVVGYHVMNLGLHLACAVLFFAVVRRTLVAAGWDASQVSTAGLRARDLAFAIALVWTVHPLVSEVVLYLSERTESLMAACYLFTLFASVRASGSLRPGRWLVSGVIACAAGMLCKESMVTAPFVVAVYDRVFLFASIRDAFSARWRFYGGLLASWAILAASMLSHGSISSGGFASAKTTTWTYLMNQAVIVTRYLRLVVWPRPLVLYYGWTRPWTLSDVWPHALFLTVLTLTAVFVFFRWPKYGFAAAWTVITLSPSSSIAAIAAEVGAERRMYLPLMGIIVLALTGAGLWARARAGATGARGRQPSAGRWLVPISVAIASALGASTFARVGEYQTSLGMARTILAGWESPSAHQLLGQELLAAGQRDAGIAELRLALPDATPARFYLGSELVSDGQVDEGIANLQEFVRLEPSLAPTKTARMQLARAFAMKQQWPQAVEQLDEILKLSPSDPAVHGLLANIFAANQQYVEAIPHYRAFIATNPRDGDAWSGLAIALVSTGQGAEALGAFRTAADIEPLNAHFRQNLTRALLEAGDAAQAAVEARETVTLAPNDASAHDVMGRALAMQGKLDDARREFTRALEIDPSYMPAREALRALSR
jgi:protein O-mannosyl-transferase